MVLRFLKANADKCHLLTNTDENITLEIKNKTIANSCNQKLLGVLFNNSWFQWTCQFIMEEGFPEVKCFYKSCAVYEFSTL